jgi:hypothetical protein
MPKIALGQCCGRNGQPNSNGNWDVVYATLADKVILDTRDNNKTTKILKSEKFIGKTKEEMIALLGQPVSEKKGHNAEDRDFTTYSYSNIKKKEHNAEDGDFTTYSYCNIKGKETFFIIWDKENTIDNGMLEGTYFYTKLIF